MHTKKIPSLLSQSLPLAGTAPEQVKLLGEGKWQDLSGVFAKYVLKGSSYLTPIKVSLNKSEKGMNEENPTHTPKPVRYPSTN